MTSIRSQKQKVESKDAPAWGTASDPKLDVEGRGTKVQSAGNEDEIAKDDLFAASRRRLRSKRAGQFRKQSGADATTKRDAGARSSSG